jgi:glc operon protein GlcG
MPDFVPTHRLTHQASLKMLQAGVAKAEALGCKVSLTVVDQSCRLIGFLTMDGARHFSIITTQRKAITAASQRQPTGYAPEADALSMAVRMGDFTNVPGGFPITVGGEVIGAVAAGGAKIEQDVMVAQAALAALDLPGAPLMGRCHLRQTPSRPCESRDPYSMPYRLAAAYGSQLFGRDDIVRGATPVRLFTFATRPRPQ